MDLCFELPMATGVLFWAIDYQMKIGCFFRFDTLNFVINDETLQVASVYSRRHIRPVYGKKFMS